MSLDYKQGHKQGRIFADNCYKNGLFYYVESDNIDGIGPKYLDNYNDEYEKYVVKAIDSYDSPFLEIIEDFKNGFNAGYDDFQEEMLNLQLKVRDCE